MNTKQKKKTVKQHIRNKNKHNARQQLLENRQKNEEAYNENHQNIIRILPKGAPLHLLYYGVKEYAMKMLNDNHTQPTSRLILGQEYANERVRVLSLIHI